MMIDKNLKINQELKNKFEIETGKNAYWKGAMTNSFKKWLKGEKLYDAEKERISLYVSQEKKSEWQKYLKDSKINTLSKLIRHSVDFYIKNAHMMQGDYEISLAHSFKEVLTVISGYSQILLRDDSLKEKDGILSMLTEINNNCTILKDKICQFLE